MSYDDRQPKRGLTRRTLLKSGAAAGAAAALGPPTVAARVGRAARTAGDDQADLVFVNGVIHTMDAANTVVKSVTIRNGRFADVGKGLSVAGPGARVVNLKGRTVVPGIIDNHNHIVLMGNRPGYHTPLENAYSIAEVQSIYASRAGAIPSAGWITTIGGFHSNHFAELRLPTLAELDAAVPNNPAYLHIGFSGPAATNSAGRAFFQARGVTVGADGSIASGTQANTALLALRQTLLTFAHRKRTAEETLAYAVGVGVTTHLDQGAFQSTNTPSDAAAHEDNYTMHLPFLELYKEGRAKGRLRINFLHMESDPALPGLVARLKNAFPFFGSDMVRTGGIGEFTASGLGPTWLEANMKVGQAGWRSEVHSLNRTDFQTEIAGFEAVNAQYDITDLRWVVAHAPFITEDWANRLKAIGGGVSLFGASRYLTGTTVNNGPPFRMLLDNGIPLGMSCDGMQVAPLNPWIGMYYATTGVNARGDLINAGNQITRAEVLRLYTAANGWFLREEDQLGSIEPGKLADLIVLSDDYFSVSDADVKGLRSVLTVVGGTVVHDAGLVG
jgi:predicted amidohydrolase YtcJ